MNDGVSVGLDFAILLLAIALPFLLIGFYERHLDQQVDEQGVDGEATVISSRTRSYRGARLFYLTFEYEVPRADGSSTTYTCERQVGQYTFESVERQPKLPIRYLPDDPPRSVRLAGFNRSYQRSATAFGVSGMFLFFAILLVVFTLSNSG